MANRPEGGEAARLPPFLRPKGSFPRMGKIKALEIIYGRGNDLLTTRQSSNAQVTPETSGHLLRKGLTVADKTWSRGPFLDLTRRLDREGAYRDGRTYHWSLSARSKRPCIRPEFVHRITGATYPSDVAMTNAEPRRLGAVYVFGRCRKCDNCRLFKREQWIARTIIEAKRTPGRIWFGTINSDANHRRYIDDVAACEAGRDKKLFSGLTNEEKFPYRAIVLKREASKYVKRLRKGYGAKGRCGFRFLCVVEPHKDFHAHAHILYFETSNAPLTERLFRARWRGRGMAQTTLVNGAAAVAAYVSKYITKDFGGTIHASLNYGRSDGQPPAEK